MVSDAQIHFTVLQTVNMKYDLNTQVGGPATFLFLLGFGDSSAFLYLVLETDLKSFIKDMLRSLWERELEAREPKSAAQPFCFLWFCSALWNSLSSWFFLGTPLTENKREWCHYKEKQERKSYSMREKKNWKRAVGCLNKRKVCIPVFLLWSPSEKKSLYCVIVRCRCIKAFSSGYFLFNYFVFQFEFLCNSLRMWTSYWWNHINLGIIVRDCLALFTLIVIFCIPNGIRAKLSIQIDDYGKYHEYQVWSGEV